MRSHPAYDQAEQRMERKRYTKLLQAQYQAAIDEFIGRLERIDAMGGTYAKLRYTDVRSRLLQLHGIATKPLAYTREIEIDEIVLECIERT